MNRLLCCLCFFTVAFVQGQQTDYVDFKTATVEVSFIPDATKVLGIVRYDFEILKSVDSIFIDAINMKFDNVSLNSNDVDYSNDLKKIWIKHNFKPNKNYEVIFNFEAHPKKALYFIDWNDGGNNQQIWTQGQGKYTSNWLPSIDDMNDKIEFDLTIKFDKNYQVIANGKLINQQINDSIITWQYDMQQPMASYLVALAIGKYDKKIEFSKSSIPLEMYYYPEDSLKLEPTYRYTKRMFDFLEEEIGVPYPWQNYKQVPVKDFLYAGMENTSATIFSDAFVIDSIAFVDKNYVNVNAHELAHQWFGDLVTEISGTHHWLQEGFATYYALLAEKEVFGDDYYYWRLYEYAQELLEQDKAGLSTSLLDPKSSSTTFYKKGAWVLHMLREKVGENDFKKAIKNYLLKHQFRNVETNDFINEVEKANGKDLSEFTKTWIQTSTFHYINALKSLIKSNFIKEYLDVNCESEASNCDIFLTSNVSDEVKIKVLSQISNSILEDAFNNSLKVRQAIAQNLKEIPSELKEDYESILDDASYISKETALYNLWNNFPQERNNYLNKTKDIQGFNDKNIRTLWLTLALVTENYEPEKKKLYFDELTNYTSPKFGFEIRQNAFKYLNLINACNAACKENLEQATKHHNWQFSKFAKDILKETK